MHIELPGSVGVAEEFMANDGDFDTLLPLFFKLAATVAAPVHGFLDCFDSI